MYSTTIDIWSFGCVLAEFAYGGPLFTGNTQTDVLSKIIRIRGMVTVDDIAHMPTSRPENIDIRLDCACKHWYKVFTRRINNKNINTSYGNKYEDILDSCLQWNPLKRISASNIVQKFKIN
jgi:glycogen synthase kinase 3 beta